MVLAAVSAVNAADWPQFRGPAGDGTSPETGLLKQWPQEGPKELWSYGELGEGYSSVSVANGLVYTTGMIDGQGYLFAFDLQGKPKLQGQLRPGMDRSRQLPERPHHPHDRRRPPVPDERPGPARLLQRQDRRAHLARRYPGEVQGQEHPLGNRGIAPDRRRKGHLHARRPGRDRRGPEQDDRRDDLDDQGAQPALRLLLAHPGRAGRHPADHDARREGPRRDRRGYRQGLLDRPARGQLRHPGRQPGLQGRADLRHQRLSPRRPRLPALARRQRASRRNGPRNRSTSTMAASSSSTATSTGPARTGPGPAWTWLPARSNSPTSSSARAR